MNHIRNTALVLAGLLVGCAGSVDLGPSIERLKTSAAPVGGQRSLSGLDVSGDGAITAADWQVFDAIAAAAGKKIEGPVGIEHRLYAGTPKDAAPIFTLVGAVEGTVDLTGVPAERLEELMVEARWAGLQARVASLHPGPIDGQAFGGAFSSKVAGYNAETMEPPALCKAVQALELESLGKVGLPTIAIFDIDSTIWSGNITDAFLAAIAENKVARPEANPGLQTFLKTVGGIDPAQIDGNDVHANAAILYERSTNRDLPKEHRVNPADGFYNIVGLLNGLTRQEVETAARVAFDKGTSNYPPWVDQIFAHSAGCGMREIVDTLQKRGVKVYLLSATLDVLADLGGDYLGVPRDQVLGSVLEMKDGKYTGKVRDSTYYTKGAITRQWLPAPPVLAFGDSPTSDFSMLQEASGAAFMVNAKPRFLERDQNEAGSRMVEVRFDATEGDGKKSP